MNCVLIILDFDGVCANGLSVEYGSVTTIFKAYGKKPPSLSTYRKEITTNFMDFYWKYGIPKTATRKEVNKIRARYFASHTHEIIQNPGLEYFLHRVRERQMRVAIVSAGIKKTIENQLERWDLSKLIDYVRADVPNKTKALQETLRWFQIGAQSALYIDDVAEGITAAKELNINTVGFTKGYHTRAKILSAKPDFAADSFLKILRIVSNGIK